MHLFNEVHDWKVLKYFSDNTLLLLCKVSCYFSSRIIFLEFYIFREMSSFHHTRTKKVQGTLSGKDPRERSHPGESSLSDNREQCLFMFQAFMSLLGILLANFPILLFIFPCFQTQNMPHGISFVYNTCKCFANFKAITLFCHFPFLITQDHHFKHQLLNFLHVVVFFSPCNDDFILLDDF